MKLSIITINYNNIIGLQKTIDSVIVQTWKDFEWIIIDGGSTDGSKELIEQYQQYFAYWCSEPDKGVYNAMNKGIAIAKGEYLNFMNSGDTFYSDKTLEGIFCTHFNEDMVYGDWIRIEKLGNVFIQAPDKVSLDFFYSYNICHQAMFIKTDLMKVCGYDESFEIYADWARWIKMLWDNCSTKHIPMVVCYFDAQDGLSRRSGEKLIIERERVRGIIPPAVREPIGRLNDYNSCLEVKDTYSLSNESRLYRKMIRMNLLFVKSLKRIVDIVRTILQKCK